MINKDVTCTDQNIINEWKYRERTETFEYPAIKLYYTHVLLKAKINKKTKLFIKFGAFQFRNLFRFLNLNLNEGNRFHSIELSLLIQTTEIKV